MVKPGHRRLKKKFVRVPSGKAKIKYERKGGKQSVCGICKVKLQGTPKGKASQIKKLPRTKKRPEVIFGGILCSKCRDSVFEEAIKVKTKYKGHDDVKVSLRKYVNQILAKIK